MQIPLVIRAAYHGSYTLLLNPDLFLSLQLEPYMDEAFLSNAMSILGQDGVVSIKVKKLNYIVNIKEYINT